MLNILEKKKINSKKLLDFGFSKEKNIYKYSQEIMENAFLLNIEIDEDKKIKTKLIETETGELYTLHLTNAEGSFVHKIKDEYEKVLSTIAERCFENAVFKSNHSYKIIDYINNKYGDKPEYLWEKFPENAIFRRKDNKKWYAAILTVKKSFFGFNTEEIVEIINLKVKKDNKILEKNIYPAYHMNKKSWISIILDGSVDIKTICKKIDESYILTK